VPAAFFAPLVDAVIIYDGKGEILRINATALWLANYTVFWPFCSYFSLNSTNGHFRYESICFFSCSLSIF
jgi:hypothetical protein